MSQWGSFDRVRVRVKKKWFWFVCCVSPQRGSVRPLVHRASLNHIYFKVVLHSRPKGLFSKCVHHSRSPEVKPREVCIIVCPTGSLLPGCVALGRTVSPLRPRRWMASAFSRDSGSTSSSTRSRLAGKFRKCPCRISWQKGYATKMLAPSNMILLLDSIVFLMDSPMESCIIDVLISSSSVCLHNPDRDWAQIFTRVWYRCGPSFQKKRSPGPNWRPLRRVERRSSDERTHPKDCWPLGGLVTFTRRRGMINDASR